MVNRARAGERPQLSIEGPQRQLSQQSSPELWGRLVASTFALPAVEEGHSQVSPASSRAVFLADRRDERQQHASLSARGGGHQLTELGWAEPHHAEPHQAEPHQAEPHQYADFGTEFLVYGPRDVEELDVVLGFITESLSFARGA